MNAELSLAFIVRIRLGSAFSVQPSAFTPMIPLFQPLKPRVPRKRRDAVPAPSLPAPVTVVSVTTHDQYLADWEFSAPVTLTGNNVPELEIDGGGQGMTGADSVVQISPTILRADYSTTTGVFPGDAWQILTQPANIQEQVEVPEEGEAV